jgi:glycosyltransferase involved in cell wall biosynthesis
MAAGKAIVAPRIPNVERILTNRQSGLLISPGNKEALTLALLELLQDEQLRTKLGLAARKEATEKYSWDRTVAKLEDLFFEARKSKDSN